MPIDPLAEIAADNRREKHRELDAQEIDLEPVGAAMIVDGIEIADLARDVPLEAADAREKEREPDEEGRV